VEDVQKKSQGGLWNENLILAGDFNFYENKPEDAATIQSIHQAGFREVTALVGQDTNASGTEVYDRLFLTDNEYFTVGTDAGGAEQGGVFSLFEHLYRDGEEAAYRDWMLEDYTGSQDLTEGDKLARYFRHPWRKNQLSDHFPIWFELVIDSGDALFGEDVGGGMGEGGSEPAPHFEADQHPGDHALEWRA
jgi:hypothetical protein